MSRVQAFTSLTARLSPKEFVTERRLTGTTLAHDANHRLVVGQILNTFKNKLAKRIGKRRQRFFPGLKAISFIHTGFSA